MTRAVELRGEGASILIEVLGYERQPIGDIDDDNWLVCRARCHIGSFEADVGVALCTRDLARLADALRELLNGRVVQAELDPLELGVSLEIYLESSGRARVSGNISEDGLAEASLQFSFETDRTQVDKAGAMLQAILHEFPVRLPRTDSVGTP